MIFQLIGYVILLLIAIIISIDVLPMFKDWLSRIHIGRYDNQQIWNKSILWQINKSSCLIVTYWNNGYNTHDFEYHCY